MKPWQRRLLGVGPSELTEAERTMLNDEQTNLDLLAGAWQAATFIAETQALAPEAAAALERLKHYLKALDVRLTAQAMEEAKRCHSA